ncbi:helix-turn-helix domain-containing protein [Bacillus sp. SD088]|uniref:helix-turn-helix domain-containing protein n=1 Tax=Bacillus sp. SD088 TaxID=2782012 RepID=UPI001A96ACF0|nr:helix-turn-helix domain-containing protein [Bacillus sp. SD088]MBO0993311.1 helix-turn-helix domain-containing protein [Bacillus sp. SD088]
MKKRRIRIPLSLQFLSFYILILIVPVLFLGSIIHFYLLANIKGQVMESNEKKLIQMKDILDTKLSEFHRISLQVSSQHELTPYYVNNFFDVFKAKKILNYKVGNDSIYELFYYIRGNDYLFSSDSSYSFPSFTDSYFQFENWSYEDFYQTLNESQKPFLRNPEKVRIFNGKTVDMITYGVPVPFNSKHPYGTLLFFIDEKMIQDMLKNVVNTSAGNAFILDEQYQVVAGLYHRQPELNAFIKQVNQDGVDEVKSIIIDHETYYVSHVKSEFQDWSFFTLTPESELMKDVNSVKHNVLIAYGIVLFIGILLIYIGMQINYKPLGNLIRRVEEKWSRVIQQHHGLEKISEVMHYSELKNQHLSKHVEKSRPVMQQHLLIRLLRGEIADYQELNALGAEIHLQLKESDYYVMLMEFHQQNILHDPMKIGEVKKWLTYLPNKEKYQIDLGDLFGTSKLVFILSGEVHHSILNDWYIKISKESDISVTIGVGNSYRDTTQMGKSHLEAETALHYQLIKGINQIIFFSETSAENLNMNWYDRQIVDQLELCIRQRNMEQVEKIMMKITGIIQSSNSNLFMAKCLMFDVSSTVMRIIQDIQPAQEKHDVLPDVLQINDFHSTEEMEEMVTKIIRNVFDIHDQAQPDLQLLDDLLIYIQDHYHEYQFSIQALAEHFSLSEAYIMRYFKKHTGETILQHLNRIRMDQTKLLLKTSDLQVKEIAMQVGYSDVSSFIRKFKQQENMTPGEFRKKHTEKNVI